MSLDHPPKSRFGEIIITPKQVFEAVQSLPEQIEEDGVIYTRDEISEVVEQIISSAEKPETTSQELNKLLKRLPELKSDENIRATIREVAKRIRKGAEVGQEPATPESQQNTRIEESLKLINEILSTETDERTEERIALHTRNGNPSAAVSILKSIRQRLSGRKTYLKDETFDGKDELFSKIDERMAYFDKKITELEQENKIPGDQTLLGEGVLQANFEKQVADAKNHTEIDQVIASLTSLRDLYAQNGEILTNKPEAQKECLHRVSEVQKELELAIKKKSEDHLAQSDHRNFKAKLSSESRKADRDSGIAKGRPNPEKVVQIDTSTPEGQSIHWLQNHDYMAAIKEAGNDIAKLEALSAEYKLQQAIIDGSSVEGKNDYLRICRSRITIIEQSIRDLKEAPKAPAPTPAEEKPEASQKKDAGPIEVEAITFDENITSFDELIAQVKLLQEIVAADGTYPNKVVIQSINEVINFVTSHGESKVEFEKAIQGNGANEGPRTYHELLKQVPRSHNIRRTLERLVREYLDQKEKSNRKKTPEAPKAPEQITKESFVLEDGTKVDDAGFLKDVASYEELEAALLHVAKIETPDRTFTKNEIISAALYHVQQIALTKNEKYDIRNATKGFPRVGGLRKAVERMLIEEVLSLQVEAPQTPAQQEAPQAQTNTPEQEELDLLKSEEYFELKLAQAQTKEDIDFLRVQLKRIFAEDDPILAQRLTEVLKVDKLLLRKVLLETSFRNLGLEKDSLLAENPEFANLSPEQQLLALQNLEQVVLEYVKNESVQQFEESQKSKGFLKKIWGNVRKNFLISKNEQELANKASEDALKVVSKERFSEIIKEAGHLPVEITQEGTLQVSYADTFNYLSAEEFAAVNEFNVIANKFARIPEEWRYETATKSQRKQYEEAKEQFDAQLLLLTDLKKKEIMEEAIAKGEAIEPNKQHVELQLYLNEVQANVAIQQFLQTHPEAGAELDKLASNSTFWKGLKLTAEDKATPGLIGFGIRSLAPAAALAGGITSIAAITAPLAGLVVGGIVANRRVNEELTKKEKKGRKGGTLRVEVTTELSRVNGRIRLLEEKGPLLEEERQELYNLRAEKRDLETKLDGTIAVESTSKNLAPASFLFDKLDRLVDKYHSTTDEMEKARILQSIKVRVDYTQSKVEEGLVSYGKDSIGVVNQVKLTEAICTAQALVVMQSEEAEGYMQRVVTAMTGEEKADIERASFFNEKGGPEVEGNRIKDNAENYAKWNVNRERYLREDLQHLLASKEERIRSARFTHKVLQVGKGMVMGAGFGAAGYWLRHLGGMVVGETVAAPRVGTATPQGTSAIEPSVPRATPAPATVPRVTEATPIPRATPQPIAPQSGSTPTESFGPTKPVETPVPQTTVPTETVVPEQQSVPEVPAAPVVPERQPAATMEIVDKKVRGRLIHGSQEQVVKNYLIEKGVPRKQAEGMAHDFINRNPEVGKNVVVHAGDKVQIFENENGEISEIKIVSKAEAVATEQRINPEVAQVKDTIEDYKAHGKLVRDSTEHSVLQLLKKPANLKAFGYDPDTDPTPTKWAKAKVEEFFSKPENQYLRTAITHDGNEVYVGQKADGSLVVELKQGTGRTPTFKVTPPEGVSVPQAQEIPEQPLPETAAETSQPVTPPEETADMYGDEEVKPEPPVKEEPTVAEEAPVEPKKKLTPQQVIEREKFLKKQLPFTKDGTLDISKLSPKDRKIYLEITNEISEDIPLPKSAAELTEIKVPETKPIIDQPVVSKDVQYIDVPNTPNEPLNVKENFHPAYDLNLVSTQGEFNETAYKEMLSINPRLKGIYDGIERANQLYVDGKGRHWIQGRTTIFGGGKDELGRPGEVTAISGESFAGLNPNRQFYISARWPYNHIPKSVLQDSIVEIRCPRTGKIAYAYPNEWGPSPIAVVKSARTGRYVMDLGEDGRTPRYWNRSFDTSKAVLRKLSANDKEVLQIRLIKKGNFEINSQGNLVEKVSRVAGRTRRR